MGCAESANAAKAVKSMYKLSFIFSLLMFAAGLAQAGDGPDFSGYPQTAAFRFFLSHQTNGVEQLSQSNLLAISKFIGRDNIAVVYSVTRDGHENDGRWVYDWALQNSHNRRLSADDMGELQAAIEKLPTRCEAPPIGRLVIVSFSEGTNWVTRTYDSGTASEAMNKVFGILDNGG
jgi:hypothetical protein